MLLEEKPSFTIDPIRSQPQEQKKVLITFNYVTPVRPSHLSPLHSHFGRAPHTSHIEKVKQLSPFQELQRQDGSQGQQQRYLRGSYHRRKIFENDSASIKRDLFSKELQVNLSQENKRKKIKSALHYSEYRQKKKRNNIFQDYNPKANTSVQNQPINSEPDHLFPLHQPPRPQSLVRYVDLGQHRRERVANQESVRGKTYISEIKKGEEQDLIDFRIFQGKGSTNSHTNKNVSEFEFDESANACSHREINESKEEFGELLQSAPRFYDRANEHEIPPIPNIDSYVDIKLFKSSDSSGWERPFSTKQVKENNFTSSLLEKVEQIYQKVLGNKNTLPLVLITLGLVLLLIQIAK